MLKICFINLGPISPFYNIWLNHPPTKAQTINKFDKGVLALHGSTRLTRSVA